MFQVERIQVNVNKNAFTCNFCANMTNGDIYQAKQHINDEQRNAKTCHKCP